MTAHVDVEPAERLPEDVPDGTFGHARHRLPAHITPCTPAEQARHCRALNEALSGLSIRDLLRRHPNQGETSD
ncbi:hypothetical protein AB0F46_35310 [Streptomyces sp. NPDC026665]|uniref:hypothetical protein n=1 Tax=Streptomyces sp. NPDC026665 TaxID=3154798 RepID=UPI00340B760C